MTEKNMRKKQQRGKKNAILYVCSNTQLAKKLAETLKILRISTNKLYRFSGERGLYSSFTHTKNSRNRNEINAL